jgi:TetR/AcrR family transcriptional regulator, tetracycline repressor protein
VTRPGRPVKARISKDSAARAALAVIDKKGLDALSLEQVARRIGVKAPSLYHHFHGKSDLLAEVARCILLDIEAPRPDAAHWEETFVALCVATRRGILRHPNAAPLLLQFFPRNVLLGAYNFWSAQCPYPAEIQMLLLEGAEKLCFGSALFAASSRASGVKPMPHFEARRYPALARAMSANPYDEEAQFIAVVRAFVEGIRLRADAVPAAARSVRKRATRSRIGAKK